MAMGSTPGQVGNAAATASQVPSTGGWGCEEEQWDSCEEAQRRTEIQESWAETPVG